MLRLTLKNLTAHKGRFTLTTFGVMLAVSFVVSAFVLGDGLRASFGTASEDINAGVDLEVRAPADLGTDPPLPVATVQRISEVDGVAVAAADIEAADDAVRPLTAGGDHITTDGPPQLAFAWIDDEALSPFTLVEGAPPAPGEFAIDLDSAREHGFVVGDTYQVMTPSGTVPLRLSGTSSFGPDNATLGAVLMQMHASQAGALFGIDGVTSIKVRLEEGADGDGVAAAIGRAVPGAEVLDRSSVVEDTAAEFTEEIDIVGNILLGFGGVALLVSAFLIYNTFAIVVGQRSRELALLRTVGADPRQIRRSVLGEALAAGAIASAGGIAGGVGLAAGIEALFEAGGATLVPHPTILAGRTMVAAVVTGLGVTLLAAVGPARRAAGTPPVSVLGGAPDVTTGTRRRTVVAGALVVGGAVAGVAGLEGLGSTAMTVACTAVGAVAVFLGVTLLSPLAVGGVTRALGWVLGRGAGVAGRLAQRNAARNPRRTATTAAALTIGLALVSTAMVVGESAESTIGSRYEESADADWFLTDELGEVRFPAALVEELRGSEAVSAVAGFVELEARVEGTVTDVSAADLGQVGELLDLDLQAGGLDSAEAGGVGVLVSADEATATGVGVGDVLAVEAAGTSAFDATVVGVFRNQALVAVDHLFDATALGRLGVAQYPEWLALSITEGTPPEVTDALVEDLSRRFPYASVETAAEFRERVGETVDQILTMVDIMVALALIIALIGIANTLALSVFERTRELGLVRAVGMTRRQLRRMVRLEAALVAAFGGVVGVGLGLVFGIGAVAALPSSFASAVAVPASRIATVVAVTTLAAVGAAWLPARRAGRLDVLAAISH